MNNKFKLLFKLFSVFFKIGLFTFGGGYAMIPLIQHEVCEKNKYVKSEEIIDLLAVSQSTPGPISVNTATFVGYKVAGVAGAACCTIGLVTPSYIIMCIIASFFTFFEEVETVKFAFNGIRVGVVVLMIKALTSMWKASPKGTIPYIIMSLAFICVAIFNLNVLVVIISSAIIGLSSFLIARKEGTK